MFIDEYILHPDLNYYGMTEDVLSLVTTAGV